MSKWEDLFNKNSNFKDLSILKQYLKQLGFNKTFKIFNIVGTNGKGSVAKYLTDSFINNGYKVGTFTSPHIYKPNERIMIDNIKISDKDFFDIANKINGTFFEVLYITAMLYFQKNNIDIAIIEAGIGGKKDTTNTIDGDYGVVTSIGKDHMDLLGNTLEEIAKDKAGIINKDMEFFYPSTIKKELKNIFCGKEIINNGNNYREENINLVKGILSKLDIEPIINHVEGRTEIIKNKKHNIIIDVAHNLDGIQASLKLIKQLKVNFSKVIITINKSKNITGIKELFPNKDILFYKPSNNFHDGNKENIKSITSLSKEIINQSKDILFIGTFYTIAQIKKLIESFNE